MTDTPTIPKNLNPDDIYRITSTGKVIRDVEATKKMDFPFPIE